MRAIWSGHKLRLPETIAGVEVTLVVKRNSINSFPKEGSIEQFTHVPGGFLAPASSRRMVNMCSIFETLMGQMSVTT